MNKARQESLFWGFLLLVIGTIFMLKNLGVQIDIWNLFGTYWPVILIAIGLKNIVLHVNSRKDKDNNLES